MKNAVSCGAQSLTLRCLLCTRRLRNVSCSTLYLCRLRIVGAHDVRGFVGHWIHHAMFHRACMRVLDT
eukprot:1619965-Amphidinium_carterae.1